MSKLATVLLMMSCGACGILGGSQPQYDYFVLTPTRAMARPTAQLTAVSSAQPTLGISDVTVPGYLDRESIVTRTDEYQLIYSKQDRWAEPLDQAFERSLREDLATALAPAGITVPPHATSPTYDLHVDVLRFERHGAYRVELWAHWILRADGKSVASGDPRIELAVSGAGSGAVAAALSQAIARLAVEIADHVRNVPRKEPVQSAER